MANRVMLRSLKAIENQTRPLFSFLLDFFFPPRCVSCQTIGKRICGPCTATIAWIDSGGCPRCGLPQTDGRSHICIDPLRLQFIRSAAVFSGAMRKALHALKYDSDRTLAAQLVRLAYRHWVLPTWDFDVLLPVPLGKLRERTRGYNQSLLLANAISQTIQKPVDIKILSRIRETQTQVGLSYGARKQNMLDAFSASAIEGKKVLLVDDVCTTGATLQSCADALARAGAVGVGALTLARAVLPAFRPE
jgi:ComF family protein